MVAVLGTASVVSAEAGRAAANQPAKAARSKPPLAKPAATPAPRTIKPLVAPIATKSALKSPAKVEAPTASAVMQQYQHVGHDLVLLRSERNAKLDAAIDVTKESCAELHSEFRTIKIEDAVKTPQARAETAALLKDLQKKVDRLRGVAVTTDCMNNPLAKDCLGEIDADDPAPDLSVPADDGAPGEAAAPASAAPAATAPAPKPDAKSAS